MNIKLKHSALKSWLKLLKYAKTVTFIDNSEYEIQAFIESENNVGQWTKINSKSSDLGSLITMSKDIIKKNTHNIKKVRIIDTVMILEE